MILPARWVYCINLFQCGCWLAVICQYSDCKYLLFSGHYYPTVVYVQVKICSGKRTFISSYAAYSMSYLLCCTLCKRGSLFKLLCLGNELERIYIFLEGDTLEIAAILTYITTELLESWVIISCNDVVLFLKEPAMTHIVVGLTDYYTCLCNRFFLNASIYWVFA